MIQRFANWLRFRWATRSMAGVGELGTGLPTEQHAIKTDEEKFREEHGYSMAVAPMPWSDDIARHNKAIHDEYAAEVEHRKELLRQGMYKPRFYVGLIASTDPDDVNWDLEMTLAPGRRLDVSKDIGVPENAPAPTTEQIADRKEARWLHRNINRHENAEQMGDMLIDNALFDAAQDSGGWTVVPHVPLTRRKTVADLVGSRAAILSACGGNEEQTEKVIAKALEMFSAKSLDDEARMPQDLRL